MLIHVAIVSEQILANLIPALMEKPDSMHLACSKIMAAKRLDRRLKALLESSGIKTTIEPNAPDSSLIRISSFARTLASKIKAANPGAEIVLNATCGNKLMMLGFVDAFNDTAARILYTDTQHRQIEYLPKRGEKCAASRAMKNVLNVPEYLRAQAFLFERATSDDREWKARADRRKPVAAYFAANVERLSSFIGAINFHASRALDKHGTQLVEPRQQMEKPPRGQWEKAMQQIADVGLIKWDEDVQIEFPDVEAARFLSGGWLEEHAWHALRDQSVHDVRMSVTGKWEYGRKAENEFDVLAANANQLLVIECKTLRLGNDDRKDSDILYKLDSLGQDVRGLFGSSWLLAARRTTPEMHDRAQAQGIRILGPDEISRLADCVKAWMTG